ncbi:hypothetical protein [Rhizobium sp. SSA_523]|uniref:hypothetical protein n=1 Tax=Rhizobium sp. SSA_523 TaxID=2952477 RepID=UPI00209063F4|nr:hypothetical protein [Rhizobium sp. SSA_523]MCO5731900.1 hypothetical protein [Rhizobium sp. SSA_523]WKC22744.1 hypothetical protein QTJ18_18030 [Rhizobium sp. SSA_523]
MTQLLFSLPVHERPDIVRGQIENINFFAPGSHIVIHIAQLAADLRDEFLQFCAFDNVTINPACLETVWSSGILHTHVSNFEHARQIGIGFDKIVLISSNEMLIKPGISDYLSPLPVGAQTEVFDDAEDWAVFDRDHLALPAMQKFLAKLDLPVFFGGQAEGQFFHANIFEFISELYQEFFPMGPVGFPIEEVVPPTIAARLSLLGVDIAPPVTLCDYCIDTKINPALIEQIRRGTGTIFGRRTPRMLKPPHLNRSLLAGVFSVKRVPREDCELRRYICGLMRHPADPVLQTA